MNKNSNHPIGLQSDHSTNRARPLFTQRQNACSACKTPQGSATTFKLLESFLMRGVTYKCDFSSSIRVAGVGEPPSLGATLKHRGERGGYLCMEGHFVR
ncbi:hypothetical protein CDAR_111121 [Caerostris darwini]|uniref:Uncharacterized protein n=1 Tax=Caerostris darwini TaxID=1538125 RepID=A0AAV4SUK1_9ARAC|nr:hypothetical protein CDAR_111121 [Caerostris darwini]